ncbi:MAG: hypothetical protein ACLFSN_03065, partial [Candidatus Woesearchaeota archaeon]
KFYGLFFSLFTLYFSILVFFVNGLLAIYHMVKKRSSLAKLYIFVGILTTLVGLFISFTIPRFFL